MKAQELRIGNYLRIVVNGPAETVEAIGQATGIGKDNVIMGDSPYGGGIPTPFEYLQPILLTEEWLLKAPQGLVVPEWIKFVHELQNYYYWTNNKTELIFKSPN